MIGGGVGGDPNLLPNPRFFPSDVLPQATDRKEPTIPTLPAALEFLLGEAFPDALWIDAKKVSDFTYVLWMLDLDYSYNEWIAHLSIDHRWTLSPVRGPCYDTVTTPDGREHRGQWRKRGTKI